MLITALFAYPLSLKNLPGRKAWNFYVFFTMLFSGGLIPSYMMWTGTFHIKDTIWAQIIPTLLMSAMNVLLVRTYFSTSIPDALFEAAQIDGASQMRIFRSIVIPLGKPILVTIGTFSGLAYWNDWNNGLYYITQATNLYGIQNLLNRMVSDLQFLSNNASGMSSDAMQTLARTPTTGVQMAIAFVAILPILILFPFLQKYSTQGHLPRGGQISGFIRPRQFLRCRGFFLIVLSNGCCFAALMAADQAPRLDSPSFAWTDQDPRGPWTRCPTRPCHPLQTHETARGARSLRFCRWTPGRLGA